MNTNYKDMTVLGPDELAELEETAIDGSQDSARVLYQYYLDPAHYDQEKASYWGSFLNEEPEAEEAAQTPAEGMSEAERWMLDYNNGITEKMMIRQLQERAAEGDPFAPIVMADSLDRDVLFCQSRYEDAESPAGELQGDYLNAPFDKEEYERFETTPVENRFLFFGHGVVFSDVPATNHRRGECRRHADQHQDRSDNTNCFFHNFDCLLS